MRTICFSKPVSELVLQTGLTRPRSWTEEVSDLGRGLFSFEFPAQIETSASKERWYTASARNQGQSGETFINPKHNLIYHTTLPGRLSQRRNYVIYLSTAIDSQETAKSLPLNPINYYNIGFTSIQYTPMNATLHHCIDPLPFCIFWQANLYEAPNRAYGDMY